MNSSSCRNQAAAPDLSDAPFYWYCVVCNQALDADKGEAVLGDNSRWYCSNHYAERWHR